MPAQRNRFALQPLIPLLALLIGTTGAAQAQTTPSTPPTPVLNLEATASSEVSADIATMQWFVEVADSDSAQASMKAAGALAEALNNIAKEPAVVSRRTQLNTFPAYNKDGKVNGWRARADVFIEGTDFANLSKAGGRLGNGFAIAQVSYRLSDAARSREEERLSGRAIADFRQKAQSAAHQFGFRAASVKEVTVRQGGASFAPAPRAFRMMAAAADAPPMPLEGGQATVNVTVTGSVYLYP